MIRMEEKKIPPQKSGAVFLYGQRRFVGKVVQSDTTGIFNNSFGFSFP